MMVMMMDDDDDDGDDDDDDDAANPQDGAVVTERRCRQSSRLGFVPRKTDCSYIFNIMVLWWRRGGSGFRLATFPLGGVFPFRV